MARTSWVAVVLAVGGMAMLVFALMRTSDDALALTDCDISAGQIAMSAGESEFLDLLNNARQQAGRAPLAVSPNLQRAAAWMANDMEQNVGLSHTDSLGRLPFQRLPDCGYTGSATGENVATTFGGAQGAFSLFQSSELHNENMMHSQWTVIGVAQQGSYWVLDFGSFDDSGEPPATAQPTETPTPPATETETATETPTGTPTASATPTRTEGPAIRLPVHRAFAPGATKGD